MATTRPFAYNTGSTIDGTIQVGNIAIGVSDQDYSQNPGGVKWWMGPDEDLGYVIVNDVPTGNHPTQVEVNAYLNFWRSTDLTDQSFIDLLNSIPITNGLPLFTNINDAQTWLSANGHFTSYDNNLPTPTPTPTSTPLPEATATPTPTPTVESATPTPTDTPIPATSTPTPEPTNAATDTPTPTPTATEVPATDTPTPEPTATSVPATETPIPATSTPTPTPTAGATGLLTFYESGSDVIMSVSGTIDLSGLTLVQSGTEYGGNAGGLGTTTATFLMASNGDLYDTYSGFTTTPTNFGSGGGGGADSSTGDAFGVIFQGAPPYQLAVPNGYTSGSQITGTQTFTGQTFTTLGLVEGTYTYIWSGGSFDIVIGGTPGPTPTPTPTSVGGGVGSWYFYSDEGTINANIPKSNGNAMFTINTGGSNTETFNPNKSSGVTFLYFNVRDSVGTNYTSQFSGYTGGTGTITISQNGDTATYTSTTPGSFFIETNVGVGGSPFFVIAANPCTQTKSSNAPFVYADPISITFGS